ncbi:MAG: KEOPS complex kinase/ATPase Bud32 [Candidatus Nanoarchaeia archaeon]
MKIKVIDSGAEAEILLDGSSVVKSRVKKGYRINEIDEKLRKFRTRREAKVLSKLQKINFPAPKLFDIDDSRMRIGMEFVEGSRLRDVLYKNPLEFSREIGRKIGVLHSNGIIHGDLTTSNMILDREIKFIDFGLSFFSDKTEDKAVDLHLLRQALESKHHTIWEECFKAALEGYKESYPEHSAVLDRLQKVEARGRNKSKSTH